MKTGNTSIAVTCTPHGGVASMEPGHEDREYTDVSPLAHSMLWPQWSPVMKTGNTAWYRVDHDRALRLNGARS